MCSPSQGTLVSGPSVDVGELHGVAGDEDGLGHAVGAGHLDEHVAGGHVLVGDHLLVAEARARPRSRRRDMASHASRRVMSAAQVSTAGRMTSTRGASTQPWRSAKRGSPTHSGLADQLGQRGELVLAADLDDEPAVVGAEAVHDQRSHARRRGAPATRSSSPGRSSPPWRRAWRCRCAGRGPSVAVAQRGEHADDGVQPGADVAERADRRDERRVVAAALELVDPRHGLDDRRERRPRVVGRGARCSRSPETER